MQSHLAHAAHRLEELGVKWLVDAAIGYSRVRERRIPVESRQFADIPPVFDCAIPAVSWEHGVPSQLQVACLFLLLYIITLTTFGSEPPYPSLIATFFVHMQFASRAYTEIKLHFIFFFNEFIMLTTFRNCH